MKTMNEIIQRNIPKKALYVFLGVGLLMVTIGIGSICTAEMLMPDNAAGQRGVLIFYRSFCPFVCVWGAVAAISYINIKFRRQ
ncbi:MAG: hypothetical protein JXM70_17295 [Pirellulales bacterium]|nr:hypothetical protein [Pirellulales bacterium]